MLKILKLICKFVLRLFKSLMFLIVVLFISKYGVELLNSFINDMASDSIYNIYNYGGRGTSFQFLHPNGKQYTVTNYHVCKQSDLMQTDLGELHVFAVYPKYDLCILEPIPGLIPFLSADRMPYQHEKLYTIGSPTDLDYSLREGRYITLQTKPSDVYEVYTEDEEYQCLLDGGMVEGNMCKISATLLQTTIFAAPGASGSPVYNSWGNLIGITKAVSIKYNTAYVIPVKNLVEFITEYEALQK